MTSIELEPTMIKQENILLCTKKGATIGWGHWIKSEEEFNRYKDGITEQEAIRLKQQDLKEAEIIVNKHITVPVTQDM